MPRWARPRTPPRLGRPTPPPPIRSLPLHPPGLHSTPPPPPPGPPQPPPPSTQPGIPFGFFMGDYYQLGPTWTATLRGASVGAVVKYLQIARERGARVFIQFAGGRDKYLDAQGN